MSALSSLELSLIVLVVGVVIVAVVRFRSSSLWVDALLVLGLAGTGALLKVILTRWGIDPARLRSVAG